MRTTLQLPEPLWRSAKERAARDGTTLTQIVESALRLYLKPHQPDAKPYKLRWRPQGGQGHPGLDINSRVDIYEKLGARGDEFLK